MAINLWQDSTRSDERGLCSFFFWDSDQRFVFSVKSKVSEVADCATNSEPKASPTRPQIGCRTSGCKKHKGRRWKDPSSAQCPAPQNSNWDCTGVRQGLNLGTLEDWWTLQFQEFDLHHLILYQVSSSTVYHRLSKFTFGHVEYCFQKVWSTSCRYHNPCASYVRLCHLLFALAVMVPAHPKALPS